MNSPLATSPSPHPHTQRPIEDDSTALTSGRPPILADAEVALRMLLLAELQAALVELGFHSVLARNQRLVLQYNQRPCEPSGLTDPDLHIFTPDGTGIATTDGATYALPGGRNCPVSDPGAAAAILVRSHRVAQRA